ncbi:hypothetical protein DFQ29_003873 [Apophysomyces sp. BC1021]|nr:hypothetical protein DFQ29_003873 [Apophysomyces sp. BC1021]
MDITTSKTVVNDKTAEHEIDLIKDAHKNLTEILAPKPGTISGFNEGRTSEPRWGRQRNRTLPIAELDNMHNRNSDGETVLNDLLPLTKESVLHILKQITSVLGPTNKEIYEKMFVTRKVIQSILMKYFDKDHLSRLQTQVDQWISADGSFGRSIRLSTAEGQIRGRWLWVLKRSYQVSINFRTAFR